MPPSSSWRIVAWRGWADVTLRAERMSSSATWLPDNWFVTLSA